MLARQRVLIQQLREEAAEPPSRYRSDAPPAYDDVINKPEDYPIYHAHAQGEIIFSSAYYLYSVSVTSKTFHYLVYNSVVHSVSN